MVTSITHSRTIGSEVWITSDGRAYFTQLCGVDPDDADGEDVPGTVTGSIATSEKDSSAGVSNIIHQLGTTRSDFHWCRIQKALTIGANRIFSILNRLQPFQLPT